MGDGGGGGGSTARRGHGREDRVCDGTTLGSIGASSRGPVDPGREGPADACAIPSGRGGRPQKVGARRPPLHPHPIQELPRSRSDPASPRLPRPSPRRTELTTKPAATPTVLLLVTLLPVLTHATGEARASRMIEVHGFAMRVWTEGIAERQPGEPVVVFENGGGGLSKGGGAPRPGSRASPRSSRTTGARWENPHGMGSWRRPSASRPGSGPCSALWEWLRRTSSWGGPTEEASSDTTSGRTPTTSPASCRSIPPSIRPPPQSGSWKRSAPASRSIAVRRGRGRACSRRFRPRSRRSSAPT